MADETAPGGTGGDGKATPLTSEDVNKQIHAILTEREKRTLGKIEDMFKTRDANKAKAKEERKAARQAKKAEKKAAKEAAAAAGGGAPAGTAPANGSEKKPKSAEDARLKAVEKQLAEERKLREEERSKRLADEERSSAMAALGEAGIVNVKGALAILQQEKRIGRDKDGQVVFKVQREGYIEDLPIKDGVRAWTETDEGKFYVPPVGAAGSGAGGGAAPRGGRPPTRQEKISEAMATLGQLAHQRPTQ